MQIKLFAPVLALSVLLSACGEGEVPTSNGGNDVLKELFHIHESTPVNGAQRVPTDQVVTIKFMEDLNTTTISSTTVRLMATQDTLSHEDPSEDMDANVEPDGPRTIVLTPSRRFRSGQAYHVLLEGVQSASGESLVGKTIEFRTIAVGLKTETRYNDDNPNDPNPALEATYQYQNDASGHWSIVDKYDAGNQLVERKLHDGRVGSVEAEDIIYSAVGGQVSTTPTSYEVDERNSAGNIIAHAEVTAPGSDGQWGDSNDLITQFRDHNHMHENHRLSKTFTVSGGSPWDQIYSGSDTQFNNATVTGARLTVYDEKKRRKEHVIYKSLGSNGEFDLDGQGNVTPTDDQIDEIHTHIYDATTGRITTVNELRCSDQPCPVGVRPTTSHHVNTYHYDALGPAGSQKMHTETRADINGQTIRTRTYEYDGQGNLTRRVDKNAAQATIRELIYEIK